MSTETLYATDVTPWNVTQFERQVRTRVKEKKGIKLAFNPSGAEAITEMEGMFQEAKEIETAYFELKERLRNFIAKCEKIENL